MQVVSDVLSGLYAHDWPLWSFWLYSRQLAGPGPVPDAVLPLLQICYKSATPQLHHSRWAAPSITGLPLASLSMLLQLPPLPPAGA